MEQSPILSYEQLESIDDVAVYSILHLNLTSGQAANLQKAEKNITRYQLSEALNDNKRRSTFSAIQVMFSELWNTIRYPKLAPVRGLFMANLVSNTQFQPSQNGNVLVSITIKKKVS